jgi:putative nucleotidyltransferase with HDIG domain
LEIRELRENPDLLRLDDGGARRTYLDFPAFEAGQLTSFLVLPIVVSDEISGIISLGFREHPDFTEDDDAHARQLADQMGVALSNAQLMDELDRLNWGTLIALARAIDAKSPWTAGHSERVTALACEIGRKLGISDAEIDTLTRGGLLHDIGKIGTPFEVLDKPGRLTDDEVKTMRNHVAIGAQILEPVKPLAEALPILLQHHERWDGKGYPLGLAGDEIHILAQILSVADAFDAMQSNRPYRRGREWGEAVEEIRREAGRAFNPDAVSAFLELITQEEIQTIFRTEGHAVEHLAAGVQRAEGGFRMPLAASE